MRRFLKFSQKYILPAIKWLAIAVVFFIALVLFLFQLPFVQTKAASFAANKIGKSLNTKIEIQYIHLNWIDRLELSKVTMFDQEGKKMIEIESLEANFLLRSLLFLEHKIVIEDVFLKKPDFNMLAFETDSTSKMNIDFLVDAILNLTSSDTPHDPNIPYQQFIIRKVSIQNGHFSYDDLEMPKSDYPFDPFHMNFQNINANVSKFRIVADTFEIYVAGLTCVEKKSNIESCNLNSFLRITENTLQLHQLNAHIGNSFVSDSLAFSFNSYSDFSDFLTKVKMNGKIKNSLLHHQDLALFHPIFNDYPDIWRVENAEFEGTVEKLNIKNAIVNFGKNSKVTVSAFFNGLPNISETFMNIQLKSSSIQATDMRLYLEKPIWPYSDKLGKIFVKGQFSGFNTDFVAYANLKTSIGEAKTDLNLKFDQDFNLETIDGDLSTSDFNLGLMISEPYFGKLNATNKLNIKKFNTKTPVYFFESSISNVGIKNQVIHNINTKFKHQDNNFDCHLAVNDSIHRGTFSGRLDQKKFSYDFEADFQKLNISSFFPNKYVNFFKGKVKAQATGNIMEPIGWLEGENIKIWNNTNEYATSKLSLTSTGKKQKPEHWTVETDHVHAEANGDLNIDQIANHVFKLLKPIRDQVAKIGFEVPNFEIKDIESPRFKSTIILKQPKTMLDFFLPDIVLSDNSTINLVINESGELNASMENNKFSFHKMDLKNLNSQLNMTPDNGKTILDFIVSASEVDVNNKLIGLDYFSNLSFDENDSLFLNFKMEEPNFKNYISLNSKGMLEDSNLVLTFQTDSLLFANRKWTLNRNNLVVLNAKSIMINRLILNNENQIAEIFGNWGLQSQNLLYANLKNIDLDMFNQYLTYKLEGNASAMLILLNQNENFNANISMLVDSLVVDERFVAKIRGNADWDNQTERIGVDVEMLRSDFKILDLSGYIYPNKKENNIDLRALFQKTDIRILEAFTKSYISNLSGSVSGVLTASGMFEKPEITGELDLERTKFKINYTQCTYVLNDKLYFGKNKIFFSNAKFTDNYLNQGILNGGVSHQYFSNIKFNIDTKFQNIETLNTEKKDNNLYYGQAFTNGFLNFSGNMDKISLTGNLSSEKDTKLTILLNSDNSISRNEFITFKSKTVLPQKKDTTTNESFKFEMLLNLDLDKNAVMDIIVDEVTGDALSKSNGEGQIQLEIDSKGDFNMFGKYTISQGKYNFTYLNLIRKEFNINPNSTISWNGDPMKGVANLTANFEKFSPLTPIVRGGRVSQNDSLLLSRRYPTNLKMKLTGEIMRPTIDFNIEINQTPPELNTYVQEFKNLILSNEQELNRQVLSLLLFGRLSPESTFSSGAFLGNSISELISGQLSEWINQIDDELTVDVNINTLDYEDLNTLRFRLSRTFLDKRLRVMVEDGVNQNRNVRTSAAALAGDWTIEYLLLQSGILRIKMYNRTTQNLATSGIQQATNTTAGASIMHSQEFEKLFFNPFKKKRQDKKQDTAPQNNNSKEALKPDEETIVE